MAAAVVDAVDALVELPPGPALAAALAQIDAAQVPNNGLLALLRAHSRQAAHESARLLGVIAEIGRATPVMDDTTVTRAEQLLPYAADEIRAALSWSRRAADSETDLAEHVVHHLPQVYAAFLAGQIDRPKVRVFADHLCGLTTEHIAIVCGRLVPVAPRLTPGQLAVRLRRLIAGIDPRHYERRYRKALRDRTVCAWLDRHGTAIISAHGLTPAEAQAAIDRINTLAHAARRAGHPSTLDQIRTDLVVGLLDGTLHHLTHDQIIAHLIAHRSANDDAPDTRTSAPGGAAGSHAMDEPTARPADHSGSGGERSGGEGSGGEGTDGEPTPRDGAGQQPAPEHDVPEHDASEHDASERGAGQDQRRGVEVRVALSTLLGHDDHPGEIAGLGPVPASHARDVVARQRRAEWRWVLTDTDGRLLDDGITRRRPTGLSTTGPPDGIVELQVPAHTLPRLAQHAAGALDGQPAAIWAPVIADIARHHANRESHHANRDRPQRNKPERPELDAHPDDRLPRAALRRHIQIRDRTCVGPGCRHRPSRCDQDHTVAVEDGGTTVAADRGPLCRHDHTLKTNGGWTLVQPTPGRFVWITPLRGRYHVQPEPVLPPLPEPCPAPDDPEHDEPAPESEEVLMIWRPAPPPSRPTTPDPEPRNPEEPAPF